MTNECRGKQCSPEKIAYIFLAGEITDYSFTKEYNLAGGTIICADGGYKHAENLGITPQYIVGDMDSIADETLPQESKIIKHPTDKDYTDGYFALKLAAELGCAKIIIFGALNKGNSSRFDHVLGNVHLLDTAHNFGWELFTGLYAEIVESDCKMFIVGKHARIERKNFKYISLLPITRVVTGVTLTGMKYPLKKAQIVKEDPIAMSNEFTENIATVTIRRGKLLAILCTA